MATSEIVPFATDVGANVVNLAAYTASAMRTAGFQTGPAQSAYVNRAIRQSALIAAAVSQYIATIGDVDSLDNGDVNAQVSGLVAAVTASFFTAQTWSATRAYAIGNQVQRNGELYIAVAANTNSAPPNSNWRAVSQDRLALNVAGGVNVTLTETQSQYRVLALSGAIVANIAVIVPTTPSRSWFVVNNTTGGFTLTVRTAAGTGVAIPQGNGQAIYSDATGVLPMGPPITSAGVINQSTALNLSGPLTYTGPTPASFRGRNSNMASSTTQQALEILNDPANSTTSAAMIRLVRSGLFVASLGVDVDNRLKWGGGTLGGVTYDIWNGLNAPASLSAGSGYQVLPSGFMIQGALTLTSIPDEGPYTVTFPTAFPTAVIAVIPIIRNTSGGPSVDYWAQYVSSTLTTATIYAQKSNHAPDALPSGLTYIAIGY